MQTLILCRGAVEAPYGWFWAQKTEFGSHEGVLLVEVLLSGTNGLDGIWLMKSHEGQKWVLRVIYGS